MKTIYPITVLVLAVLLIYSCTNNDSEVLNDDAESNPTHVPLHIAGEEIALYDAWLKMLPESAQWDSTTRTLSFSPITVDSTDALIIDEVIKAYDENYESSQLFPFTNHDNLAKSYFIHEEDIQSVLRTVEEQSDTVANGIRVYMGFDLDEEHQSHIFIGPAYGYADSRNEKYDDYYLEADTARYLLDLTTPCPKACGGKMKALPNR